MTYSGFGNRWFCASCNKGLPDFWEWKFDHKEGNHATPVAVVGKTDKSLEQSEPYQFIPRNKISVSVAKKLVRVARKIQRECCDKPHGNGEDGHE